MWISEQGPHGPVSERGEVDPLVPTAGDEHDRVEPVEGRHGGMRRRRLGVVVPDDPVHFGDPLEPVRQPVEAGQGVGYRLPVGPYCERQ